MHCRCLPNSQTHRCNQNNPRCHQTDLDLDPVTNFRDTKSPDRRFGGFRSQIRGPDHRFGGPQSQIRSQISRARFPDHRPDHRFGVPDHRSHHRFGGPDHRSDHRFGGPITSDHRFRGARNSADAPHRSQISGGLGGPITDLGGLGELGLRSQIFGVSGIPITDFWRPGILRTLHADHRFRGAITDFRGLGNPDHRFLDARNSADAPRRSQISGGVGARSQIWGASGPRSQIWGGPEFCGRSTPITDFGGRGLPITAFRTDFGGLGGPDHRFGASSKVPGRTRILQTLHTDHRFRPEAPPNL